MKTKLRKVMYTAAAALFIGGLAINIYMTVDDPFDSLKNKVIAQNTTHEGGGCPDDPRFLEDAYINVDNITTSMVREALDGELSAVQRAAVKLGATYEVSCVVEKEKKYCDYWSGGCCDQNDVGITILKETCSDPQ